jgi:hypothetical protein
MKIKNNFLFLIFFLLFLLVRPVLASDIKGSDLEIILDCSSSMSQPLGNIAKIEAAKKAISNASQTIPDKKYFGLRAFGHRTLLDNKKAGCQDSELLIPIAPVSKDAVALKVKNLSARGGAPISYSLQQTRTDFSTNPEYQKIVVLVSDGKDNCDADPCATVKEMRASGFNLVVNTIGLAPSPEAESQLRCIAAASGGEFTKAYSTEDLEKALSLIFGKAYSGISSTQSTQPGSSFTEAPPVQPGKFSGVILPGEIMYYKLTSKKGQEIMATLSIKRDLPVDNSKSKENLGSCIWLQPSIKVYDQFQTLITGYTPGAESGKIIKEKDSEFKNLFANWKAESDGDLYVAFSNQWLSACPTSAGTQFREQYNKSLYELNVAIEGAAIPESAVSSNVAASDDQPVKLSNPENSNPTPSAKKTGSGGGLWTLIAALVILIAIIGGMFYLIKKKGWFGKKKSPGKITEAYDASTGNLTELSEKSLMGEGSFSKSRDYTEVPAAKPADQSGQIKLSDNDSAYISCPNCHAKNLFGSRICTSCGKKF